MKIDHDQIFKTLIEAFFKEFMILFYAAEAALIDFTRVEFLRKEYFTDLRKGKRKALDLVAQVGLLAGGESLLLIHIEFESDPPRRFLARRMFLYTCQLYLRHEIAVIPIVVFTDDSVRRKPIDSRFDLQIAGETYVQFRYKPLKLKSLDYRQFLDTNNPLAYALMAKMNYNKREQVRLKADFLRLILGCGVDPARASLLVDFVETYVPLKPKDQIEFDELVKAEVQYEEVAKMVTVYEKRGIEKGIEKGMKKGIEKGMRRLLISLLTKKFGKLPSDVVARIEAIDSNEKLDELSHKILDATSLSELLD